MADDCWLRLLITHAIVRAYDLTLLTLFYNPDIKYTPFYFQLLSIKQNKPGVSGAGRFRDRYLHRFRIAHVHHAALSPKPTAWYHRIIPDVILNPANICYFHLLSSNSFQNKFHFCTVSVFLVPHRQSIIYFSYPDRKSIHKVSSNKKLYFSRNLF